jgi:hypothetical protein
MNKCDICKFIKEEHLSSIVLHKYGGQEDRYLVCDSCLGLVKQLIENLEIG